MVAEAGPGAASAPGMPSLEAVGKARELADRLGARVAAAWRGSEEQGQPLVHGGADELVLLEGGVATGRSLASALASLARERRFEAILAPATPLGGEVAGRVAIALGTGALGDCVDLDLDEGARLLVGSRRPFGGALQERAALPGARPQVVTLRPGAARAPWPDDGRTARVTRLALPGEPARNVRAAGREPARGEPAWRGAERLVVGGALLGAEGFEALRSVAGRLGAAWACTRAAAALGLAPPERALVPWDDFPAPALCLAAGIEDPLELNVALPWPRQLVALGDGPLARAAAHVVPGTPDEALRALAERLG